MDTGGQRAVHVRTGTRPLVEREHSRPTGGHADVDVLANDIAESFHSSYVAAAAGNASVPKHVAIPSGDDAPTPWFKQHWKAIDKQILSPKITASSDIAPLLCVLYTGTTAEQLRLLAPADRKALVAKVFDTLVRYATDDT